MQIDGIDGSVTTRGFEGWHEVLSFSWGESNSISFGGGGGGIGRVNMQDMSFTKLCGKGSPKLFLNCASGQPIPNVVIAVNSQADPPDPDVQMYRLSNCFITSYQVGGDSASLPTESLSVLFARIEFTQFSQTRGGTAESHHWNVINNEGG
jgi:type VI secretion system secreted protein Hcp